MNYKLIKGENNTFHIKETATDLIIESFSEQSEAKKYMKFLNLGGAFDGFTPSFILNNTSKNM